MPQPPEQLIDWDTVHEKVTGTLKTTGRRC